MERLLKTATNHLKLDFHLGDSILTLASPLKGSKPYHNKENKKCMGYNQSINSTIPNEVQALVWQKRHQTSTPKVGETALDVQLLDIKG